MIDNGVSGFLFALVITVFLFRSVIVAKNEQARELKVFSLIVLCALWIFAILEIANSIWAVIQVNHNYSYVFVSPTLNGFIIGLMIHIALYKNSKYAGK